MSKSANAAVKAVKSKPVEATPAADPLAKYALDLFHHRMGQTA